MRHGHLCQMKIKTKEWLFQHTLAFYADLDPEIDADANQLYKPPTKKLEDISQFISDMVAVKCDDPDTVLPHERGRTIYGFMKTCDYGGDGLIRFVHSRAFGRWKDGLAYHNNLQNCWFRHLSSKERKTLQDLHENRLIWLIIRRKELCLMAK